MANLLSTSLIDEIAGAKGVLLADGATGTNLFTRGLETGYPPELWNVEREDEIAALHDSFLEAGSDLILTNSFGGNALRLKLHQAEDRVAELNEAAARIARQRADHHFANTARKVLVAGSIGPTGELFAPMGALTHEIATDVFTVQAKALANGGVDLLWIETMSSTEEVAAALEAAKTTGLAVGVTMTFDTAAHSMMGVTPQNFAIFANAHGADFMGANCGIGPAELLHSVDNMRKSGLDTPLIAKGNCGIPAYVDGAIHYHGTPELMGDYARFARDMGARIVGGCCGTTPKHVAAMLAALVDNDPRPLDYQAMSAALGPAWANVPEKPTASTRRRSRRR